MKYLLLAALFLLSACSIKEYEQTQTKIIIIKSQKLKFSDLGYLRSSGDAIELELFIAGSSVEKISINHLICTSEGCMSKSGFNEDYLNANYPSEILQNILLGKSIYDGKNRVKTVDGFEQKIKNKNVEIIYKVSAKSIYFKDKKNKIIFKIKDTK